MSRGVMRCEVLLGKDKWSCFVRLSKFCLVVSCIV